MFGCLIYIHIPVDMLSHKLVSECKLSNQTFLNEQQKMFFYGYNDNSKAYHCYDPTTWKILLTKNVVFYKSILGLQGVKDVSFQEIMIFVTRILVKKTPHMVFLPHVQFEQNAILDVSFWPWSFWLVLFGWFFWVNNHDNIIWATTKNIIIFQMYLFLN
jgi:hypothetical protein